MGIPTSVERVPRNTPDEVNRSIREAGEAWVSHASIHPELIPHRLQALDREWDIERVLEANASALCVLGVALGAVSGRKWFVVPGIVGAFLFQHAIQGWCPPLPVLRRLGFRTRAEIDGERFALLALAGDLRRRKDRSGRGTERAASGRGSSGGEEEAAEAGRGRSDDGRHKKQKQGEGSKARKGEEGR